MYNLSIPFDIKIKNIKPQLPKQPLRVYNDLVDSEWIQQTTEFGELTHNIKTHGKLNEWYTYDIYLKRGGKLSFSFGKNIKLWHLSYSTWNDYDSTTHDFERHVSSELLDLLVKQLKSMPSLDELEPILNVDLYGGRVKL